MDSFSAGALNSNLNSSSGNSFFSHIFSTNDESKAEFLNVFQYSLLAIIPVLLLNKFVHFFIPDLDIDKSSLEILAEILLQIFFMFSGILLIHRFITFFPTYSGFKYDHFSFTNFIIAFFVIIFSIQTKLGNKINTLFLRAYSSLFPDYDSPHSNTKKLTPLSNNHIDNNHYIQIPSPSPLSSSPSSPPPSTHDLSPSPAPANSFSSFGSHF
jgi:hypothetical protein